MIISVISDGCPKLDEHRYGYKFPSEYDCVRILVTNIVVDGYL
jgi:hypothetical protein